jgi:tetratricopeptide (TPR) repeat protein
MTSPRRWNPERRVSAISWDIGSGRIDSTACSDRGEWRRSTAQTVAIKLVRGALGDPARIARFGREQRILAQLRHPFIAHLIDVGVAADETPYLVMEFVEGKPITAWCDERNLDVTARLRLVSDLCSALAFAHGHLVVHRDLKPSNVFVTGDGVVKLLDFGVAKLLGDDSDDGELTRTGARVLSPRYASPEQILGDPVTTATDVHGLGLLLYELLTGQRAYGGQGDDPDAVVRAILHDDVRPPSALMRERRAAVKDLDAICLKALAKKPEQRYPTVDALRDDLVRHLDGLPVGARLPTLAYRAGKFARRHRTGVAISALVALLAIGGVGAAAWQGEQARRALAEANELSSFLIRIFRSKDAVESRDASVPMRGFVDLAMIHIDEFNDAPAIQARMLIAMSEALVAVGEYNRANDLASRSLALRRGLGPGHEAEVAASLAAVGTVRLERGDVTGAEEALRSALTLQRAVLKESDLELTGTMLKLAEALRDRGAFADAELLAREALAARLRTRGRQDDNVVEAAITLASVIWHRDPTNLQAEKSLQGALAILEGLHGVEDFRIDPALTALGEFWLANGRFGDAQAAFERSLTLRTRTYGGDHPRVAAQVSNVGRAMLAAGRDREAREVFRDVIARYERLPGSGHLMVALATRHIGETFAAASRLDSAEVYLKRALDMRSRIEGQDAPRVAELHAELGSLQLRAGRLADASASLTRAHEMLDSLLGREHPTSLRASVELGRALDRLGQLERAETLLRVSVEAQTRILAPAHPDLARSLAHLGTTLSHRKQWTEANDALSRALTIIRLANSPARPIRREIVAAVVDYYRARGTPAEGMRILREEAGVAGALAR